MLNDEQEQLYDMSLHMLYLVIARSDIDFNVLINRHASRVLKVKDYNSANALDFINCVSQIKKEIEHIKETDLKRRINKNKNSVSGKLRLIKGGKS